MKTALQFAIESFQSRVRSLNARKGLLCGVFALLLGSSLSFASAGMPKSIFFRSATEMGRWIYGDLGEIDGNLFSFRQCSSQGGQWKGEFLYSGPQVVFSFDQQAYRLAKGPALPPYGKGHLVSYADRASCEKGVVSASLKPTLQLVFEPIFSPRRPDFASQLILTVDLAEGTAAVRLNCMGETSRVVARGEVTHTY